MNENSVYEFLTGIAKSEIINGKKYEIRIAIDDGGCNSYIGFCVDVEDFQRKTPVTSSLRLFRHTNTTSKLINAWEFDLGDVCNHYADYPDIVMSFKTYGKTFSEAAKEANGYFAELKRLIKKRTAEYEVQAAQSAHEEREKLLKRLMELDGDLHEEADHEG